MKIIFLSTIIYFVTLILSSTVYAERTVLHQIEQEHKKRLQNTLSHSNKPKAGKLCYMTYLSSSSGNEHITERQAKSHTGFVTEIKPTETKLFFKHKDIQSGKLLEFDVPFRKQLLRTPDGSISENLNDEGMLHDMYTDTLGKKIIQHLIPIEAENLLYFKMLRLSYEKNNSTNSVISMYECYN